ncbi:MAG: mechanosensitive ion channel [Rhodocyclales bacterium]|nr:mechanosensitive ion channel [Rhodocyclales bacterium]
MNSPDFTSVWHAVLSDLRQPDLVWQLAALAACLLLAKLGERLLRSRPLPANVPFEIGQGWLQRVAFPLLAMLLVWLVRALANPHMHVNLFSLALPLLASLAIIRLVFYVLRYSFLGATWLAQFERGFSALVWGIVVLHVTGLLPDLIKLLEGVSFTAGKQKLTLWTVLQGVVALLITVLGALWLAGAVERRLNAAEGMDGNLRAVLARLSKALLIVLAILIGLPMVGIDLTTLSVFGGALGVGLGLGLQKIASNYVSGFIILLDNSVRVGNVISVGSDRGEVTRITTRYTVLKDVTGVESLVPNELLVGSVVRNESYSNPRVRLTMPVQIAYESDLERAMEIMVAVARTNPRVLAEPGPAALLAGFGDSGINLDLALWVADPEHGFGPMRSDIYLAIWREFKAAGIGIPYPQREVRVLQGAAIE